MMKLISVIDTQDYEFNFAVKTSQAVRAVVIERDKILLLKSDKNNYYTFPGGKANGLDESLSECLKRETVEETGYVINDKSIRDMGFIIVIKKDSMEENTISNTTNYYYFADVKKSVIATPYFNDFEIEEELHPVFVPIKEAYEENLKVKDTMNKSFIYRDIAALKYLLDNPKYYSTKK